MPPGRTLCTYFILPLWCYKVDEDPALPWNTPITVLSSEQCSQQQHHSLNWKQTSFRAEESSPHGCERLIGTCWGWEGLGLIKTPGGRCLCCGEKHILGLCPSEAGAEQTNPLGPVRETRGEKWAQAGRQHSPSVPAWIQCWLHTLRINHHSTGDLAFSILQSHISIAIDINKFIPLSWVVV